MVSSHKIYEFPFKKIIIAFLIVIAFIFFLDGVRLFMFTNSKIICGKVYNKSNVRGVNYLEFKYNINGKIYYGSQDTGNLIDGISYEDMKNTECIKIEYSNYWNIYSRIIDNRIVE
jgi:hypothetical protein